VRNVIAIASSVVRDAARKKIFYVVFLFGIAVLALAPLLPTFDLGLRAQFLRDISISLTSLFGVVLAVVLSVNQVPGEVDKRTIYNILSKPVSRAQYLLGKYVGILVSLAAIMFVMGIEILILLAAKVHVFSPIVFEGVFAVFLESAIIAAFCLMFSTFAAAPITVFAAILFYFVCHMKTGFLYSKMVTGTHGFVKVITGALYYAIPNLENYNTSNQMGYGKAFSLAGVLRITGYAALFAAVLVILGFLAFRRRDL
jgi:ABC-type transport system involved in multi-copper enzyme maturation permease subunit